MSDIDNIQQIYLSFYLDEDYYKDDYYYTPQGTLELSYMIAPFDPATATGKMYGKDYSGYVKLQAFYPTETEVFVPRGADKQWYNLIMPLDDMKDFISGAREYYGFMLRQMPSELVSFNCTQKYYISSENDSTHLRPKMVIIYGDNPVSIDPALVKNESLKQSIFFHDKNDIIINGGLPEVTSLAVYNIQGKLVTKRLLKDNASALSLNSLLKKYSEGVYFCTLMYAGEKYSIKFHK